MRGNGDYVLRFEREFGKVAERHFKRTCHCLEETSRTCGAFVVHCKVLDRAVRVYCNTFDVLSADVDDCLYARVGDMYAHCVAGNLGNVFVCRCDFVSAVTRTYEVGEVFDVAFKFGNLRHDVAHSGFRRKCGVDFALDSCICDDFAVLVHNDCFGVG